ENTKESPSGSTMGISMTMGSLKHSNKDGKLKNCGVELQNVSFGGMLVCQVLPVAPDPKMLTIPLFLQHLWWDMS
ncbi:hypothetical protein V6O07_08265, partial [Arthrospira platensis SPKY2]